MPLVNFSITHSLYAIAPISLKPGVETPIQAHRLRSKTRSHRCTHSSFYSSIYINGKIHSWIFPTENEPTVPWGPACGK